MANEPHPIDIEVGAAVRAHRKAAGLSQGALATAIGITFQQLQKYERGANRISASKLWAISKTLGAPVAGFFPDSRSGESRFSHQALSLAALVDELPREHIAVVQQVASALKGQAPV